MHIIILERGIFLFFLLIYFFIYFFILQSQYKGDGPRNHKSFMQLKEKPPSPHVSFLQGRTDLQAIMEQPPPGQSFFTGFEQDRTEVPLAELQQYQAGPMRAQDPGKGQTQGKLRYFSLQRTPATKIEKLPGASKQPPKPQIENMFFKSSASSPAYKEALSSVDGELLLYTYMYLYVYICIFI